MLALALLIAAAPLTDVDADVAVVRATHEAQLLEATQHAMEIRLAGGGTVISGGFLPRAGGTITGPILAPDGANCSNIPYSFTNATGMGIVNYASGRFAICILGAEQVDVSTARMLILSGTLWMPESTAPTQSAGATWTYTDSTSHKWRASYNNDAFADVARSASAVQSGAYTNATNGFTTITGVSTTLPVGQWYCIGEARFTQSTAGEGATFKLTSTAGTISGGGVSTYADGEQYDAATLADSKDAAVETVTTTDASVSAGHVVLRSAVNVATTMTYVLQGAEAAAHVSGTVTVAGASISCARL